MKLFQSLVDRYKDAKQKSLNKKEFTQALIQAVEDGKLTNEEITELETRKTELGLTDEDIKGIRAEIFTTAFSSAKADQQITKDEEEELKKIQKFLGLSDEEISVDKKELARLRLLNEIQLGNIPVIGNATNVILQKNETPYWIEPSTLAEERVLRRRYEGGSNGMSFRVMKGVSYRVGSHKGHIVNETGVVSVSTGDLIITNKRVIFRGDMKSFAIKLDDLLGTQVFTNGIYLTENNKPAPRMVKFQEEGNHDIIGAILSYSINHYGE